MYCAPVEVPHSLNAGTSNLATPPVVLRVTSLAINFLLFAKLVGERATRGKRHCSLLVRGQAGMISALNTTTEAAPPWAKLMARLSAPNRSHACSRCALWPVFGARVDFVKLGDACQPRSLSTVAHRKRIDLVGAEQGCWMSGDATRTTCGYLLDHECASDNN